MSGVLDYPEPRMTPREVALMHALLDALRPRTVIEWGAGGSTLTFPAVHHQIRTWVAVEHTRDWYLRLRPDVPPNVRLHLAEPLPWYTEVIPESYPAPDLCIVDGIARNECLRVARMILAPGGIVALHDADRPVYQHGRRLWPHRLQLTRGRLTGNITTHQGLTLLWADETAGKVIEEVAQLPRVNARGPIEGPSCSAYGRRDPAISTDEVPWPH